MLINIIGPLIGRILKDLYLLLFSFYFRLLEFYSFFVWCGRWGVTIGYFGSNVGDKRCQIREVDVNNLVFWTWWYSKQFSGCNFFILGSIFFFTFLCFNVFDIVIIDFIGISRCSMLHFNILGRRWRARCAVIAVCNGSLNPVRHTHGV